MAELEPNALTAQNPNAIRTMFGGISKKYDLANSILSLGIHHQWKKKLVRESQVQAHHWVLDCATGTGDLAFLFEAAVGDRGQVIGSDFCAPMLDIARKKASLRRSKVRFDCADVMSLPYLDSQFDIVSISFGIRNVPNTTKALQELGRVIRPMGRLLILEFGQPTVKWWAMLFNFYSKWLLPWIGGWISGNPEAYRYLQKSSSEFPCSSDFLNIAKNTGLFETAKAISIQGGIAYLYVLHRRDDKNQTEST
jgi:demethylmenaquinone methyltransferase/2-methoxy-6-polyprenyl-1,4-benzoquinol methylase